jgi:hypothetical protein
MPRMRWRHWVCQKVPHILTIAVPLCVESYDCALSLFWPALFLLLKFYVCFSICGDCPEPAPCSEEGVLLSGKWLKHVCRIFWLNLSLLWTWFMNHSVVLWYPVTCHGEQQLTVYKVLVLRVHQFGRRAPVSSFLKSSEKFKYKASKKFNENMGM